MTMLFFSLGIASVSGGVLTTGVVIRRRATTEWMAPRPAAGQARGLVFVFFLEVAPVSEEDSFTPSGEDGTRGLVFCFVGGALLPFVLRVVAGACVGRRTGQPRMPPQERLHEGLGELGDCFTCPGEDGTRGLVFCFVGGRCCRLF